MTVGVLFPRDGRSDAFFTYGVSPRTIGMGGAFSATADDWTAAYYNSAGIGFQHRPALGFAYSEHLADIEAIGADDLPIDNARGLEIGVVLPIPFEGKYFRDRFTFGLTGYMPAGRLMQMEVAYPSKPQLIILRNANRANAMYPALGVRITDGLAVGVGIQTFMNTIGELRTFTDSTGALQTETGQELVVTYAPSASLLFKPGAHWDAMRFFSLGLVWRQETYTQYEIPVYAAMGSVPFIVVFDAKNIFTPRQYIGALAVHAGRFRGEVDVSFNEYSRYPDPNLYIDIDVDIPIVPIDFQNSIARPPHFHDTVTGRVGLEVLAYAHADVDLFTRLGYAYDPSPVPPQTGYTNQLDADRHLGAASVGVRWHGIGDFRFAAPFTFDVAYQLQVLPRRVHYKNPDVDHDNEGYPKVGMEGTLHTFGVLVGTFFDYE